MARALIRALRLAGHEVDIVSDLRSFSKTPHSQEIYDQARKEAGQIVAKWQKPEGDGPPDIWFSYHPYYKAPDLIALEVLKSVTIPVVTAEASLALKRDADEWQDSQRFVRTLLRLAKASFYFTDRDLPGLQSEVAGNRLVHLPPFIDTTRYSADLRDKQISTEKSGTTPVQLVTMGMMRGGVKYDSYALLARALEHIWQADWHLSIIGDGNDRGKVEQLFAGFAPNRITWTGEVAPQDIASLLAGGDIFVWPGFGEAYGLAYLEAQAAGLPVIAQNTHGVPFAVKDGETAILVATGDDVTYAQAISKLIEDAHLRTTLGDKARQFVHKKRNLKTASQILDETIRRLCT